MLKNHDTLYIPEDGKSNQENQRDLTAEDLLATRKKKDDSMVSSDTPLASLQIQACVPKEGLIQNNEPYLSEVTVDKKIRVTDEKSQNDSENENKTDEKSSILSIVLLYQLIILALMIRVWVSKRVMYRFLGQLSNLNWITGIIYSCYLLCSSNNKRSSFYRQFSSINFVTNLLVLIGFWMLIFPGLCKNEHGNFSKDAFYKTYPSIASLVVTIAIHGSNMIIVIMQYYLAPYPFIYKDAFLTPITMLLYIIYNYLYVQCLPSFHSLQVEYFNVDDNKPRNLKHLYAVLNWTDSPTKTCGIAAVLLIGSFLLHLVVVKISTILLSAGAQDENHDVSMVHSSEDTITIDKKRQD